MIRLRVHATKMLLLTPAAVGFACGLGVGLTTLWATATEMGRHCLYRIKSWIGRARDGGGFNAIIAAELEWSRNQSHQDLVTYFMKPLRRDAQTGQVAMLVRYPAGEINPNHAHPIGHAMYVLQGSLVTHRGTFGRDTFVWFPPHETMRHGAGPDEDLIAIFLTGPNLETRYEQLNAQATTRPDQR